MTVPATDSIHMSGEAIKWMCYDRELKRLTVQFWGGRYEYEHVPASHADRILSAQQHCDAADWFYKTIEGKRKSTRVGN